LRYRFGMTLSAIGERMGIAPGAVDGRIRRTLESLRDRGKDGDDE